MSGRVESIPMEALTRDRLELAGVQLAVLAAALHLLWGVPRGLVYLRVGRYPDPRPFLFVASALAVAAAAVWLARGGPRRPLLAGLATMMVVYLLGYAWWHLGSHGGGLFPALTPLQHDANPVVLFVDHLRHDPFVLVTVVAEVGALGALLAALRVPDAGR
jgi:hypothetical protein